MQNEFNAIRLCIVKAIASSSYQKNGKCLHTKRVVVDMPCSDLLFREKFLSKIPNIALLLDSTVKFTVTPSDLEIVFGEKWNTFNYKDSSTQRRIIGLIQIHFRKKTVPGIVSPISRDRYTYIFPTVHVTFNMLLLMF